VHPLLIVRIADTFVVFPPNPDSPAMTYQACKWEVHSATDKMCLQSDRCEPAVVGMQYALGVDMEYIIYGLLIALCFVVACLIE